MSWIALLIALASPPIDAKPPRRLGASILDCRVHSTWREPKGWKAAASGDEVWATAPSSQAVLVRTFRHGSTDHDALKARAGRLAGVTLTWDLPETVKRDRYDRVTLFSGRSDDGSSSVRLAVHERGFGRDVVWIEIAQGEGRAEALAAMEAARTGERRLVDHACACGDDCDRRP